jgi:predicted RNA polymerase sigma factor
MLQVMIAACHARAVTEAGTDWIAITAYYQAVALHAPGMACRPAAGLTIADTLQNKKRVALSQLPWRGNKRLIPPAAGLSDAASAFNEPRM